MELILLWGLGVAGLIYCDIFGEDDPSDSSDMEEETGTGGVEEEDIGASVIENDDGSIAVELGEDEAGSLVALKFEQTADGENFDQEFSLGLYLAPENVEVPIDPTGQSLGFENVQTMIQDLGLTELARFDLGTLPNPQITNPDAGEGDDTRVEPPQIISDDPIEIIRVRFSVGDEGEFYIRTEPDETYSPFEAPGNYYNGVEAIETASDFTGTDATDYVISTGPEGSVGVTVEGLGGDDALLSDIAQTRVDGGDGDDQIFAVGDASSVQGGDGDDTIGIGPNGIAMGGAGDDDLSSLAQARSFAFNETAFELPGIPDQGAELFGGAGNDYLAAGTAAVTAHGGAGNDRFVLADGASGFGDEGDDFFNVGMGTTADGGAGDDRFQMVEFATDGGEAAVLTGGAGADVYEFNLRNAFDSASSEYLRITDFDPAEDVLHIGDWNGSVLGDVRVQEAADGSYTDVIAEFTGAAPDFEGNVAIAIIRLDGVSGYSAEELVA